MRGDGRSRFFRVRGLLVWLLLPALVAGAQLSKKQEKLNAQHADAIAAARTAAEAWLKIEDAESYDKSWAAGSEYFRSQVPEQGWAQRMETMRRAHRSRAGARSDSE